MVSFGLEEPDLRSREWIGRPDGMGKARVESESILLVTCVTHTSIGFTSNFVVV